MLTSVHWQKCYSSDKGVKKKQNKTVFNYVYTFMTSICTRALSPVSTYHADKR